MTADDSTGPQIVHHLGDPPGEGVTVTVGTELTVTLHGTAAYRWTPVTASDDRTLTVTALTGQAGTVRAAVHALRPGTAELRATAQFHGDRFGPPTRLWRLTVHVDG